MARRSSTSPMIPARTRAVVLHSYEQGADGLRVEHCPVPQPGRGEVLVKMAAAPINPSDLLFIQGLYGIRKPLPVVPGLEGSGTVVASGGGLLARRLLGKRVACAASDKRGGTWAEYTIAPAWSCFPVPNRVSDDQASMGLVNPLAAWGLMEQARRSHARALVNTAAASELGRMLVRLGARFRIEIICVVRRAEQMELMRSVGAKYVLNSSDSDFDAELRDVCARLDARLALDAVAGDMTERLLTALPTGGHLTLYGGLSLEPSKMTLNHAIFGGKTIDGFWIPSWIRRKNPLQLLLMQRSVISLLARDLRSEVRARVPLEQARQAVHDYSAEMTRGKILLIPADHTA